MRIASVPKGLVWLIVFVLSACSGRQEAGPATRITFEAQATRSSPIRIELEGAVWGSARAAVVFAHEHAKTQDAWAAFARRISSRRLMAMTFNFRGYGQSRGLRDPTSADLDLAAAVEKAKQLGAERIAIVGASLGATAALVVASRGMANAVVAVSAPVSFRGLDASGAASSVKVPVLFVAGERDPAGAAEAARTLASSTPNDEVDIIRGASGHGTELLSDERVAADIERYLVDHLL